MDVTFNNVLEGKVRQYFLGIPKPVTPEGASGGSASQLTWPAGAPPEEGAPAQSGAPAPSSRPPSAAAAPPASPPALPPRPPDDPIEPEPHIIHKATVMREAAEKRREQPDIDDDEEPGGALSPPSHIIHKPTHALPSPAPAPAAPCPSPARPPSEAPPPPVPPPAPRAQTPTARPPDPYAPSRPPDPYSASRPPEQYGRYYEASVADGMRTSNGPVASPQPTSVLTRHSPTTYARMSSTIGSVPQHAASRLRESAAQSPPSQRYAMPPAQPPPPPHNDRVPPIHHPQTTPPVQRLPSAEARSSHAYPPMQQRRESSPYARINLNYDRQPAVPTRKYDPQQAYSGYRPTPTTPQILSNHRVEFMQQQIQCKQAALDVLTAEYTAREAKRLAPSMAPPVPESVRIPPRIDYPSMGRTVDTRSGYHYSTPSTSSRYVPNAPAPSAPSSTLPIRAPYRMAAATKANYSYPQTPSVQTSPARSNIKPGYPQQKAKATVSVTSLYNEIKNKREPSVPSQSKQKRESPLDLSVKTVKHSADSSTTQDDAVDSASAENKIVPRPALLPSRHPIPNMPTAGYTGSHKVDFAPNFNQYGERGTSQSYTAVPQQSHPPVRYNGTYDSRRQIPEAYPVEPPHQVFHDRSKYSIPVARSVPKIDLTRSVSDQRHLEQIRDDRNFLIEERKRPAGPIVSNIPEKMVRYETWTSNSRIEQRMSQSAREQHELMNQPVYSYTSHKQLEAYQNEQKAKLFSSSNMYRQNQPPISHRYPSNAYPSELQVRDREVPNEYHLHYPDRNIGLNNRNVIQKNPSNTRDRESQLHHLDPHSRVSGKSSVLSILRNSLETKQSGIVDPTRTIKPDIIVIDDIDDPVIDITKDNDHDTSIKPVHQRLPGFISPSFGNHIKMPKAVDSISRDSEYQHIEQSEVKVKTPENDVASRIRTKAELKSMPPSQDNCMKPDIKTNFLLEDDKQVKLLPKSQKQHLFNQIREDLRLESVIKIEKPSDPIIPVVKSEPMNIEEIERDAVIPIKTENISENIEPLTSQTNEDWDLDWASACDNFMEQLKTNPSKKKTLKRRIDSLDRITPTAENILSSIVENQNLIQLTTETKPSIELKDATEIKPPTFTSITTDVVIKQEPMDDFIEDPSVPLSSVFEAKVDNNEDNLDQSIHNDSKISISNSKMHDIEKPTRIKTKLKSKLGKNVDLSPIHKKQPKKETKECKNKLFKESKESKIKTVKVNKVTEKGVKEKKDQKVTKESKEKEVAKIVIKEELESTDDDEPLIKSKILKEKEENDRLKYQMLKDFTEKSAYVKLECCDVDVNKNNRKSLDSIKDKEEQSKGKLSRQVSQSKSKSFSIDNKNEKQDSSSESDDDLCVASRLRIRKSIKGEENKPATLVKTLAKSSPNKKTDHISPSNCSTPVRKPGFGDGSDFHPGWEEELFKYKRSLRMPTSLIAIPRGCVGGPFLRGAGAFFTRGTTSLPDLDPVPLSPAPSSAQSAGTDDLYARRPDKLTLDSDLDSNSSYSAPNKLHYDSEASSSTITSSSKAKKKSNSIVDVLIRKCGKKEEIKRKVKDRDEKTAKIIPKSLSELLPTPSLGLVKNYLKGNLVAQKEKLEEDIFYLGAFRKETVSAYRHAFLNNTDGLLGATEEFTPVVLKTRTRTESRIIRQRATIKEVFGDERPASAPPMSCRDVEYPEDKEKPVIVKKELEESKPKAKPKKLIKEKNIRRSNSIRDGLRSTKLLKRNDAKGRLMRIKKRNSIMLSMNNKRAKEMSSNKNKNDSNSSNNTDEKNLKHEENNSPVTVVGGIVKKRFKRLFGRKKLSSGFDYIKTKKKKKIIIKDDQVKVRRPAPKPSPESVIDIQKEIKGWFINKSVGETHLHRAARLGYTDCVAYCLEKMEADPSSKDNAGFTPLHVASAKGHVRIARLLLQYGANVSAAAQGGIRPLHEASENSHMEIIRLLLSYGADPLLVTYSGQTPEELTEGGPAAKLLQLHIADVQGRALEPWVFPPPAMILDQEELGCDPLASPPPASPLPPPDAMIEIQCTEAPLPPFYSLKTAPGQPADGLWCLLQDITNLLQIKSKDSLLKQIHCGSGSPKELLREIRTQEFLERAQCNQLLGAGEKVNVRASKVALVRVTDKLRQLLKIETVLIS